MQFKIIGSPIRNKFWRWVGKLAQRRIKKTEDSIVDVKSITFPSAYSILIRYEIINSSEKYEIVMQGDYQEKFRVWKENPEDPNGGLDERSIELLIKANHGGAKKITGPTKQS